jgi:hypothetical protein
LHRKQNSITADRENKIFTIKSTIMKKLLFITMITLLFVQGVKAQDKVSEFKIFDHVSAGLSLGTTGIDIDVAAPITEYVQVRAGYSFLPQITVKTDVDYKASGNYNQTKVEGKLKWGHFKLLFDVFPFRNSTFHATLGTYIGTGELMTAQNLEPIVGVQEGEGLEIGDYIISPDAQGIARASIKVNNFKPYAGVGIGHAVPRKRFGVSGDLGVMFWGSPKVFEKQTGHDVEVKSSDLGSNGGGVIKTISKVTVLPVLTVRITGRIL